MLSSAGSIVLSKYAEPLQRRKAKVQKQLEFWPVAQRPPQSLEIWENLDQKQHRDVITALARLITKAVHPANTSEAQEIKNEK